MITFSSSKVKTYDITKLAPPESDFDSYVRSIEKLIFDPADQGERFLRWLDSEGCIDLF